ncbi:MAG: hypothetical protein ABIS67_00545 [Candidatus Eisenbacteria bacterium]
MFFLPEPRALSVTVFTTVVALSASVPFAVAGVPTPWTCTVPAHVLLVGVDASGAADPAGTFSVIVRRFMAPRPNCNVVVDFTEAPGLQVCSTQPDPSTSVSCPPNWPAGISGYTDQNGEISFTLVGRANRDISDPQAPSLRIFGDGVLLATVPVAALDQDGGGLGAADQSLWMTDFFSSQYLERSDFDGDGTLGPSDLSLWLTAFFNAGSVLGCASAVCP